MKRLIMMLVLVALAIPATAFAAPTSTTCTPTGFYRDGIDLTAAQIGGKVTGDLDATGCDIGVYYGPGTKGSVKKATIENAKYFGVVNYGGKVDVKDSTISQIGNTPFDGSQHGVGILYTTEKDPDRATTSGNAEGTISGNVLAQVPEERDRRSRCRRVGEDRAQHGDRLRAVGSSPRTGSRSRSAAARRSRATPSPGTGTRRIPPRRAEACGLLFYKAGKVKATAKGNPTAKETAKEIAKANNLFDNEVNICTVP